MTGALNIYKSRCLVRDAYPTLYFARPRLWFSIVCFWPIAALLKRKYSETPLSISFALMEKVGMRVSNNGGSEYLQIKWL